VELYISCTCSPLEFFNLTKLVFVAYMFISSFGKSRAEKDKKFGGGEI
jgi:hypothetical protein